jgi:hypothetical protein
MTSRAARIKAGFYLMALALPVFAISYYGDRDQGLAVGIPVAIALGLFVRTRKFRLQLLGIYLLLLVLVLLPVHQRPYVADARHTCGIRLKTIGLALESYYDKFDSVSASIHHRR